MMVPSGRDASRQQVCDNPQGVSAGLADENLRGTLQDHVMDMIPSQKQALSEK